MQLLVKHIQQLVTVRSDGKRAKVGAEMRELGILEHATVLIEDGLFRWIGPDDQFDLPLHEDAHIIDASGLVALPGFVDAHTHAVFAGSRENEFALRAEGRTYQEIAERGGGILSTVRATRAVTKKELKKLASTWLDGMLRHGTTTVEIKSGYGLSEDDELKLMRAINELADEHFITVVPTFLGAHAIPPEYQSDPDSYITLICDRMLPYLARRHMARFCDVFCEAGYFSVEQSRTILRKAQALGMDVKVHADELTASGGSILAAELNAVSADHLEHIDDNGIRRLREAGVVAVLLPGVSLFLNHAYAPARKLIDAGVPVAIATDFNPGSCMSYSMPLMMTLACTQMRMTPEEAITACTLNGAAALKLSDKVGSVELGKQADLVLYRVPNYRFLAYHFGVNHVQTVIKRGVILEF
jgi:imidazolonepropionase